MIPLAFISTQTLIVILVIALIVFGPQKLPEIGRQIGSAMRELRKMTGDVQKALDIDGHNAYDYYNHSSYDSTSYTYTPPVTEHEPLDQYGLDDAHGAPRAIEAHAGDPAAPYSTTSSDHHVSHELTPAVDAHATEPAAPATSPATGHDAPAPAAAEHPAPAPAVAVSTPAPAPDAAPAPTSAGDTSA